jgi:putative phosphonate metabolism protein
MSTPAPRYAIYFVPAAETALYRFGASVLGYDCYSGNELPVIDGVEPATWPEVVREPRVYGFHATLKAPFRLGPGCSEADLADALTAFCAEQAAVPVGELEVRALKSFIAIVPRTPCAALDTLAQACVREFDRFRGPMSAPERARRMESSLTPRQIEHLDRWGYPYVFEDFRFHMTLTGPLASPARERIFQLLCEKFEHRADARLLTVDRIVIAKQMPGAAFQVFDAAILRPLTRSPSLHSR